MRGWMPGKEVQGISMSELADDGLHFGVLLEAVLAEFAAGA